MKKVHLIIMIIILSNLATSGQIINYDGNGKNFRASSEKISIVVNKKADQATQSAQASISLPGVLGSVVGLGVNVVKSVLSAQEAKYTAAYTATKSESELIYLRNHANESSADLNIDSINVIRAFVGDDHKKIQACDIVLIPIVQSNSGLFRFKVERLYIPYSKAKIKRAGNSGKMIDLSITIKLEALWKEPGITAKPDSGAQGQSGSAKVLGHDSSFQIKSATLGESTILIPSINPGGDVFLEDEYYSGWYQLIPAAALKYANGENKWRVGNYTLTVTVKEANPYGIDAKKIADFFNGTSPDISSLLKQFFPSTAK